MNEEKISVPNEKLETKPTQDTLQPAFVVLITQNFQQNVVF